MRGSQRLGHVQQQHQEDPLWCWCSGARALQGPFLCILSLSSFLNFRNLQQRHEKLLCWVPLVSYRVKASNSFFCILIPFHRLPFSSGLRLHRVWSVEVRSESSKASQWESTATPSPAPARSMPDDAAELPAALLRLLPRWPGISQAHALVRPSGLPITAAWKDSLPLLLKE